VPSIKCKTLELSGNEGESKISNNKMSHKPTVTLGENWKMIKLPYFKNQLWKFLEAFKE